MRSIRLAASIALAACGAGPLAAVESAPAFPIYLREAQARVCLAEYGTGNSSVVDCLAQDERTRGALAKIWPDMDAGFRRQCVLRLADQHLTSYAHLEGCIRALEKAGVTQE